MSEAGSWESAYRGDRRNEGQRAAGPAESGTPHHDALAPASTELLEGIYVYDFVARRNVFVNPRYQELTGWSLAELRTMSPEVFLELFHEDDRDAVVDHIAAVADSAAGEILEIEYRFRRADGRWLWLFSRDTPLEVGPDGRVRRMIGHFIDIEARKQAEAAQQAALRRAEEATARLDALFHAAPVGLGFWDRELRFERINDRLAEINGLPPEAHLGRRPDEVLPELENLDEILGQWRRVMETGEPLLDVEVRGKTHAEADERVWLEDFFPVRLGDEIIGLGAVVEEVTERKRAERALRRSEARYRALFDSMDQGFCVIERSGGVHGEPVDFVYLEANPAFVEHSGMADVVGRSIRQVLPDEAEDWIELFDRVARTGEVTRVERELRSQRRMLEVYAYRVDDRAERCVAVMVTDVTDRRRTEVLLREADRRKDQFLATLAHELRNPLAPLQSAIDVLRLQDRRTPEREGVLAVMERQLTHLVRLVDDLLDVSRITRGKVRLRRQPVDLRGVVSSAVETVSRGGGRQHRILVELPDAPLLVQGDPVRLAQVLINLLGNACKYSPADRPIRLRVVAEGARVTIAVRDQGIGIHPERLNDVFDMFHQEDTADQGGLGIGLTLVKSLVELHDGEVRAYSEGPGQGSEFTVTLPLPEPQQGTAFSPAQSPSAGLTGERVLVVDDNDDAADTLAMLLEVLGASVRIARDGPAGLALLETFRPRVVLLDIGMPKMNGYQVARAMRAREAGRQVRIVAVTGWGQGADKTRAREAGFDAHLTKPVSGAEIERVVAGLRRQR